MSYDVIVAGGGPAGSTLAAALARAGMDVLLLEKYHYPRLKPCGGALSSRVAGLLDVPWPEITRDTVHRVDCHLGPGRRISVQNAEPMAYLVRRDDLDTLLARRAMAAGAVVREGCPATGIDIGADGVAVEAGGAVYRAGLLACADGAGSLCARHTGLYGTRGLGVALAAELAQNPERFRSRMVIDIGACQGGYGWIFPKGDHLSVGVGCFGRTKDLRPKLASFLTGYGLGNSLVTSQRGHLLPGDGNQRRVVARDRVFLLGDAAALVDPLSGEGIYFALLSARLAARAIIGNEARFAAVSYQRLVDESIRRELAAAGKLARLIYARPAAFFTLAGRRPALAENLVHAAYGGAGYRSVVWGLAGIRPARRKTAGGQVYADGKTSKDIS